mmetsp:Transcript_36883/g.87350  ORF Transcript_36883/g.87350 Transcript_36883/m.87350 type:complete len:292 (+) Transcript_36883:564-1439(+)
MPSTTGPRASQRKPAPSSPPPPPPTAFLPPVEGLEGVPNMLLMPGPPPPLAFLLAGAFAFPANAPPPPLGPLSRSRFTPESDDEAPPPPREPIALGLGLGWLARERGLSWLSWEDFGGAVAKNDMMFLGLAMPLAISLGFTGKTSSSEDVGRESSTLPGICTEMVAMLISGRGIPLMYPFSGPAGCSTSMVMTPLTLSTRMIAVTCPPPTWTLTLYVPTPAIIVACTAGTRYGGEIFMICPFWIMANSASWRFTCAITPGGSLRPTRVCPSTRIRTTFIPASRPVRLDPDE